MIFSKHLLVHWREEDRYSIVHRRALALESERKLPDNLLTGKTTQVYWKKKEYAAEVKKCGERHQLATFLDDQSHNLDDVENTSKTLDFDEVLPSSSTFHAFEGELSPEVDWRIRFEEMQAKYTAMKRSKNKYKDRCKELKEALSLAEQHEEELDSNIRIGSGVYIARTVLEKIKVVSESPEKFARNLFQAVFANSELINKSLSGGNSRIRIDSVDKNKRDAVIGFTMKMYTGNRIVKKSVRSSPEAKSILNSIKKTLIERIRYVNRLEKKQLSLENRDENNGY